MTTTLLALLLQTTTLRLEEDGAHTKKTWWLMLRDGSGIAGLSYREEVGSERAVRRAVMPRAEAEELLAKLAGAWERQDEAGDGHRFTLHLETGTRKRRMSTTWAAARELRAPLEALKAKLAAADLQD